MPTACPIAWASRYRGDRPGTRCPMGHLGLHGDQSRGQGAPPAPALRKRTSMRARESERLFSRAPAQAACERACQIHAAERGLCGENLPSGTQSENLRSISSSRCGFFCPGFSGIARGARIVDGTPASRRPSPDPTSTRRSSGTATRYPLWQRRLPSGR